MVLRKRALLCGIVVTLFTPTILSAAGCSGGDTVKEDANVTTQRVNAVSQEQDIIDRSNGTFDSLSAEDKAALIKLVGTEANAREAFNHMRPRAGSKGAPGAAAATTGGAPVGGLPAHGPNTTGG